MYNGILLFSLKKGGNSDSYGMGEAWELKLNDISQSQKVKYCVVPPIWGTQSTQIHKDREQSGGCQGGKEKWGVIVY